MTLLFGMGLFDLEPYGLVVRVGGGGGWWFCVLGGLLLGSDTARS